MQPVDIFDRSARRRHRDRAAPRYAAHDFLRVAMLDGIADRLAAVTRTFADVLDIGTFDAAFAPLPGTRIARLDPGFAFASAAGGVQGDEDRLPFADHSFDLVVAAGTLDAHALTQRCRSAAQLGADEIGVAQELWQPLEQRRENLVPGSGTTIRSQRGRVRDRRRRDVEAETDHDAWR